MKRKFVLNAVVAIIFLLNSLHARGQDNSSVTVRKFEVAPEFTTITVFAGDSEVGLGSRLTYNLNKRFALEAAAYFFPHDCEFCERHAGRGTEGLFGVKIGKRFHKWGIFGKARPGVISFSKGQFDIIAIGTSPTTPSFVIVEKRLTSFAFDLGAVLEFYPSKRIITRLDFGTTIIHYGAHTSNFPVFDPATGTFTLRPFTSPAQNVGTFQIMAGVGFRF